MKYELLAPVGDFRNLRAAVAAGADAVYFGIRGFNMRDSAKNFSLGNLRNVREICDSQLDTPLDSRRHRTGRGADRTGQGVKMYLTLNVVVYDSELAKIEKIVKFVRKYVDAIICWDLAVIELCRKYDVPFHVSTQASVSNVGAAKFYKRLGAERIVLARELSLKQIKRIAKVIPVECFCHGAMCVAVSGRCFMSEHVHGLSANRGRCAQPCRRKWTQVDRFAPRPPSAPRLLRCQTASLPEHSCKIEDDGGNELRLENSRVMSAKDLCALPFIEEMKRAGVVAFKIEGRNRSPEYVSVVVGEYRKALDGDLDLKKGIENSKRVYNRGFSSGFYFGVPTADDFSFSENGEQTEKKSFVGKVYKYWPKVGACSVLINTGRLKVGDDVYLMGDGFGIKKAVVKSIELDGKSVKVAGKGDDVGVDFGMRVGKCEVYVVRGRVK